METETLDPQPSSSQPSSAQPSSPGFGPTPDPTRSGALWVGGAGVTLLLAAAAVLTAVRWDDIGQSAKLGGMVAITLALLAAGQRFKGSIPMTAQAIFHLGALLIPFDMAAVAILAGRGWQETLLLTAVTSVGAWYGIERAVPSAVLKWSARAGVVVLAAGIAAVSSIAMSLALAVAAVCALAVKKPVAAGSWAAIAALVPLAAFVPWPTRIAGAMADLGFDTLDRWQPLAAGIAATLVLIGVTRLVPRVEIAWVAVTAAALTTMVSFGLFANSQVNFLTVAALFVGLELLALFTQRDPLWKPVVELLALVGELIGGIATVALLALAVDSSGSNFDPSPMTIGISGLLLALAWLTADRRRLEDSVDWLTALLVGSDWAPTTVMFPAAVLAATIGLGAPAFAFSLIAIALAYWMVATWRHGATSGALLLVGLATLSAVQATAWAELGLGAAGAAVLLLAAQARLRRKDDFGAIVASLAGALVWLVGSSSAVDAAANHWPLLLVVAGSWALSWVIELRGSDRTLHVADWIGRATAAVLLISSLWVDPVLGISLCVAVAALAGIDYLLLHRSGAPEGTPQLTAFSVVAGSALGLAGVPIVALTGLTVGMGGAALAVAGFIIAGVALAGPRALEIPLAATAGVTSLAGLLLALTDTSTFAFALMAVGCTTMFVAAALRDVAFAIMGYVVVALGLALQLAVWEVMWLEAYLALPALAALVAGWHFHRLGATSWATFAPTIALFSYVAISDRFAGGSAWHAVIAGTVGVLAIIGGGYRRLVGPLVTGSAVLAVVVGYESLGPAALVPTWAWLAAGGTILLGAGVAMERSDTTPLERGQQIRSVIATQFT